MLRLENAALRVDFLDPVADRAHLGPRFAGGGYIWQMYDVASGTALLSGPEFPQEDPLPFNGQGLPESFRHSTRDGRRLTWNGDVGVAIGAGEIRETAPGEISVTQPCHWIIREEKDWATFTTAQAVAGFNYELTRTVTLQGRTLQSSTRLANRGQRPLSLQWFAHPFFALKDGLISAELSGQNQVPANPGFQLEAGHFTQKRRFTGVKDGHMNFLHLAAGEKVNARLAHPVLTDLSFSTSFVPSECVIWGNGNTFSIEPYLELALAPGESREWGLRYDFGPSSGTSSPGLSSRTPDAR